MIGRTFLKKEYAQRSFLPCSVIGARCAVILWYTTIFRLYCNLKEVSSPRYKKILFTSIRDLDLRVVSNDRTPANRISEIYPHTIKRSRKYLDQSQIIVKYENKATVCMHIIEHNKSTNVMDINVNSSNQRNGTLGS